MVSSMRLNRVSVVGLMAFSLTALLVVLWGYTQPPLADEGTGAHVFQLSVAMLLPLTALFLGTANWSTPGRVLRPLAIVGAVTTLAFAALYVLEHVYYPHYRQ